MRQMRFEKINKDPLEFGGICLLGKRKEKRPLSYKKPLHLIIKSEMVEKKISFVKHRGDIQILLFKTAKKFGLRVHGYSVNFNHMHLILGFSQRKQYVAFIRVLNSSIVRMLEKRVG